jgi:hypothetical protein
MEQSPAFQLVNKFTAFMDPEGSLPHSQVPATCPYQEYYTPHLFQNNDYTRYSKHYPFNVPTDQRLQHARNTLVEMGYPTGSWTTAVTLCHTCRCYTTNISSDHTPKCTKYVISDVSLKCLEAYKKNSKSYSQQKNANLYIQIKNEINKSVSHWHAESTKLFHHVFFNLWYLNA